jgi:biotin operon repressor
MSKKKDDKASAQMDDFISQAEAARIRGVSRAAIQDLIRRERIQSIKLAGRVLVYRSEITNYQKGSPGRPKRSGEG